MARTVRTMVTGAVAVAAALFTSTAMQAQSPEAASIPQIVGTWTGKNNTISDKKGLLTRDRTVHITEQTDRRFRGYFTYEAGRKDFFGVIFPDNQSFVWVAADSKGYNHGRILAPDRISACYVESWDEATAGCADLARVTKP